MAKRKKRNAVTLVFLLLALAALIAVYIWYGNRPVADDTQEAAPTIDLATIDTTKVTSLHYVREDADLTLTQQDGTWISKDEPGRPINQDYVKAILNAINDINADRIISEKPENLADYGLSEPAASLEATASDGTAVTLKIGNEAGASLGYYGLVNTDGIVYLLPIEIGTALQYNNIQMTAVPESPGITASDICYLNIDSRDGEDYEIKNTDGSELDNMGSSLYTWQILKPYGEGYSADSSKISEIQSNYTGFSYKSCVDYKGTDLSLYGLDNPAAAIAIGYYEAAATPTPDSGTDSQTARKVSEYKIYVGNKDAEDNYYVRIDGSDAVYTIGASSIDKMLQLDAFSLLNHYVLIPNIDTVDRITADIGTTGYTMSIERTSKKDDDGNETTAAAYYFNDKEVEEDAFKSLYTTMVSAQYDAEIKGDAAVEGVAPVMTLSYHIFGDKERTLTASFLPYDDSFYIVKKEDGARFFADKRAIDAIAAAIGGFTGTNAQ
jgi:hypothetical protein